MSTWTGGPWTRPAAQHRAGLQQDLDSFLAYAAGAGDESERAYRFAAHLRWLDRGALGGRWGRRRSQSSCARRRCDDLAGLQDRIVDHSLVGRQGGRAGVDLPVALLEGVEPNDGRDALEGGLKRSVLGGNPSRLGAALLGAAHFSDHYWLAGGVVFVNRFHDGRKLFPIGAARVPPVVAINADPVDIGIARIIVGPVVPGSCRFVGVIGTPDPGDIGGTMSDKDVVNMTPGRDVLARVIIVLRGVPFEPVTVHLGKRANEHVLAEGLDGFRGLGKVRVTTTTIDLGYGESVEFPGDHGGVAG